MADQVRHVLIDSRLRENDEKETSSLHFVQSPLHAIPDSVPGSAFYKNFLLLFTTIIHL